tara:strand:+ start:693 stop:1340 length:648 start_codon:yes stop_codon:yes gene_type:complete
MQLKKIRIYGRLRKFLGQSYFEAAVSSPAEALRFLLANFPEVERHMADQFYKIKMNNLEVDLDFIGMKGQGDIQIIPLASGSGFLAPVIGGIFSTGAAVASAAVGAVTSVGGAAIAAAKAIGAVPVIGTIATSVATDLVIDGVTSLIAPTPSVPTRNVEETFSQNDPEAVASFGFSGISNVSIAGVAVPIIYGEVFTGSVVISSGIDTVQVEGAN